MTERQYWLRLIGFCLFGGLFLFYFVLNVAVKGGKVQMPDLKGMNKSEADYKLRSLGLHLNVREERFSNDAPFGSVLEQDVEAGQTIKTGRNIDVILSNGTKAVNVPQLVGLPSTRQAALLLEQNGLELASTDSISDAAPADTVLSQAPEAGVEVSRGALVSLLSSNGPEKNAWVMPNFRGGDSALARASAQKMGLVLRNVSEKQVSGVAPGSVLAQSLSAGTKVLEGDELSLVVAAGASPMTGVRLSDISYDVPDDQVMERRVLIVVTDDMGQRAVYNHMERPGDSVHVSVRVHGAAKYSVTLGGEAAETKDVP
jgi:beta-lactam-binding protein with PASTA domain